MVSLEVSQELRRSSYGYLQETSSLITSLGDPKDLTWGRISDANKGDLKNCWNKVEKYLDEINIHLQEFDGDSTAGITGLDNEENNLRYAATYCNESMKILAGVMQEKLTSEETLFLPDPPAST